MTHEKEVVEACQRALELFKVHKKLQFKPMKKDRSLKGRSCVLGRINLRTGLISIDIYTLKKRSNKKVSSILNVLVHEVAHFQKPPYRQLYRFRWINRQHYPGFYRQLNKNLKKIKKDKYLKKYFS